MKVPAMYVSFTKFYWRKYWPWNLLMTGLVAFSVYVTSSGMQGLWYAEGNIFIFVVVFFMMMQDAKLKYKEMRGTSWRK